jgi:hypothetical protein
MVQQWITLVWLTFSEVWPDMGMSLGPKLATSALSLHAENCVAACARVTEIPRGIFDVMDF